MTFVRLDRAEEEVSDGSVAPPDRPRGRLRRRLLGGPRWVGWAFVLPGLIGLAVFIVIPQVASLILGILQLDPARRHPVHRHGEYCPAAARPAVPQQRPGDGDLRARLCPGEHRDLDGDGDLAEDPHRGPQLAPRDLPDPGPVTDGRERRGLPTALPEGRRRQPGADGDRTRPDPLAQRRELGAGRRDRCLALAVVRLQHDRARCGLDSISPDVIAASRIDGAGRFRRFFSITLPLVSPALFFTTVLTVIGAWQTFAQAYVITGGGPGNSTMTIMLYLYQTAFTNNQLGYASAIATVLFVIIAIFTLFQLWGQKKWVHYD